MVQTGPCFSFHIGETNGAPDEWIPSPHPGIFWAGGAVATADTIEVVLEEVKSVDNGGNAAFNFFVSGIDVATLRRSDLAVESITPIPGLQSDVPNTVVPYGGGMTAIGRYAYLYGFSNLDEMVARAPLDRLADATAWEFWRGGTSTQLNQQPAWTQDPNQATPMTVQPFSPGQRPLAPFEIIQYGHGYLAVAKGSDIPDPATPIADTTIYAWSSRSPVGPWTLVGPIATTPLQDDEFTYNARLIKTQNAGLLVTWNNNAPIDAVLRHATLYGPAFAAPSNLPTPTKLFGRTYMG